MAKKTKPIDALMEAMTLCGVARADANWTNGYRAALEPRLSKVEADRLYAKEIRQYAHVEIVEARFRRLALRLLRDAKSSRKAKP